MSFRFVVRLFHKNVLGKVHAFLASHKRSDEQSKTKTKTVKVFGIGIGLAYAVLVLLV